MNKENKKNIVLMYLITFFQGIVIYATISTLYRQQRGLTLSDFAIIEGFAYIFTLFFEIPFGYIADRIGYKKTLVISNFVYFLSKIIFWKAYGFYMFLLERFVLSIAIAGLSGVDISILYLSTKKEKSNKIFSFYTSFANAGGLIGTLSFALFFTNNHEGCAIGTCVTYGIAAILSLFVDEVKGVDETREKINVSNLKNIITLTLKDYKFLLFIFATSLLSSSCWSIVVMLNQPIYISLGLTEKSIGIIYLALGILGIFVFISSTITKKFGIKKTMLAISFLMGISAIWMGFTKVVVIAIIANIICDFGYSLMCPLINELQNRQVKVDDRATQLSVYAMIADVFAFMLNFILSQIGYISTTAMFIFSGCEAFLAIILIQFCYKKEIQ